MSRLAVWVIVILGILILTMHYKPAALKYPACFVDTKLQEFICKSGGACPGGAWNLNYQVCLGK